MPKNVVKRKLSIIKTRKKNVGNHKPHSRWFLYCFIQGDNEENIYNQELVFQIISINKVNKRIAKMSEHGGVVLKVHFVNNKYSGWSPDALHKCIGFVGFIK